MSWRYHRLLPVELHEPRRGFSPVTGKEKTGSGPALYSLLTKVVRIDKKILDVSFSERNGVKGNGTD